MNQIKQFLHFSKRKSLFPTRNNKIFNKINQNYLNKKQKFSFCSEIEDIELYEKLIEASKTQNPLWLKAKYIGYYGLRDDIYDDYDEIPDEYLFLFENFDKKNPDLATGIMQEFTPSLDQFPPPISKINQKTKQPHQYFRHQFQLEHLKILESGSSEEKEILNLLKSQILSQKFMKISTRKNFQYGDGGECDYDFPLYITQNLFQKEDKIKEKLKNLLNNLAEKTQDYHENCPVQDIIDPELMPNYSKFIDPETYLLDFERENVVEDPKYFDPEDEDQISPQTPENNKYVSLRSQYQWIPTKFRISKNLKDVEILGEIHNLPKNQENEELYNVVAKTFKEMIPAFEKLGLIEFSNENPDFCERQVVVKAQKYNIPARSTYSGKWHLEGKTENIAGVGIYYCSIDEGFQYDQLQFRPLLSFDTINADEDEVQEELIRQSNIEINDGCGVVFKNTMPHRFDTLVNNTDRTLERLFMNFFIVDPKFPLQDTLDIQKLKQEIGEKYDQDQIVSKLQQMGFEQDIEKGKEQRQKVRETINEEVSGWGYVFFGNAGESHFIDSFAANVQGVTQYERIEYK